MSDPILLADILTPEEVVTVPYSPSTDLTAWMTYETAEHFAQCSRKDQRGFVLAAVRIAEASRAALANALNSLVTVAIEYGEPGERFTDYKPGKIYLSPMETSYGTAVASTAFWPFTEPATAPRTYGRKGGRRR